MTTTPAVQSDSVAAIAVPPPLATCRNCDAPLHGPYCAQCGQRDAPPDPTAWQMLRDMAQEATDVDGRLATTLRALLVPGRLTRDWIAGRRARYFSPLKLYLTVSVLYFFASALSPVQRPAVTTSDDGAEVAASGGTATPAAATPPGTSTATVATPNGRADDELPGFVSAGLRRVARDPEAFQRRVTEWAPRIFFLLVPLFAACVALLYRSRRRRAPHHVWLALHVHGFAFLLAFVAELSEFTRWVPLQAALGVVVLAVLPAYVVLTLHAVYGGSWAGTLVRSVLLGVLYLAGAVVASLLALVTLLALA